MEAIKECILRFHVVEIDLPIMKIDPIFVVFLAVTQYD